MRAPGGADLGGYRYSAFGQTLEDNVQDVVPPSVFVSLTAQPLRWKGMWRFDFAGTELYDARARMWSPALGTFLSIDEYEFHDAKGTLWSWPRQNPIRYSDPTGRNPLVAGGVVVEGAALAGAGLALFGAADCAFNGCQSIVKVGDFLFGDPTGGIREARKPREDDSEHTKNARPSTRGKHERGRARTNRDKGNEKGDKNREYKRSNGKKKKAALTSEPDDDDDDDDDDDGVETTSCD